MDRMSYKMTSAYHRQKGKLNEKQTVARSYVSKIDEVKVAKEQIDY
jgi:hypothetical protein